MAIQYTYAELVTAIKTFAEDTSTDFVSQIDDFIAKAESRLLKDLDLEMFEQWLSVTISGSSRSVPKGSDVIYVNDLFIRTPADQNWIEVPRRAFGYCVLYAPSETTEGVPRYFSDFDEDTIYVVPTPDQAYSGGNAKIRATIRPTGLATGNTTTWLGNYQADMLFNACMIEAYVYLKHTAKMKEAASLYQSLIPAVQKEIEQSVRRTYKKLNTGKEGADS